MSGQVFKHFDLPILFSKLSKNFNKSYGEFLKPYGLGKLHSFYLLCLLKFKSGLKLKDLNEIIGCDKANTSRAIADMQDRGIICKNASEFHEKKYDVKLTELGFDVASKFSMLVKENLKKIFSNVTESEIVILKNIVNKLVFD